MSVRIVRYGKVDWEVDIRWRSHDGRRRRDRKVLRGASKVAAQQWGQKRERHLLINGPPVKHKEVPTLEAFAARFIREYAVANRQKPSGIAAKLTILNQHLIPALGRQKLDSINDEDIQKLKGRMTDLSPKTVSNILSVLKKMLSVAVEWDVISNPSCKVRLVKFAVSECHSYDFDEFDALVSAASSISDLTLVLVLLGGEAGLRCGEMMALEWGDINFTTCKLCVQRSEWKGEVTAPKGGRLRYIELTQRLVMALKSVRHLRSKRVLALENGSSLTQQMVRKRILAAEDRAGLAKQGVHILRHTFCSHLAMLGVPAIVIQRLAGHQNLMTTQRYMHLSPTATGQGVNALDRRLRGLRGEVGETA